MNKELEKVKKKLKEYVYLVLDKNYCDCNELNCLVGEGDKFCDGSKVVAKAIETVLQALENSIPKEVIEKEIEEIKCRNYECNAIHEFQREAKIDILQKLLEEK